MSDRPDIASLLCNPASVADLPVADVPALLDAVAREAARLDVLKTVLAARLAVSKRAEPEPSEQRPLTQAEAAEHYRIPLRTVRFLTRTRRIPSTRVGRERHLDRAEIESYLAKCRALSVAVVRLRDVDTDHDRRGGQAGASKARAHAGRVRGTRRRPEKHGLAVGSRHADGGIDGGHPDSPPRPTGAAAPKEE